TPVAALRAAPRSRTQRAAPVLPAQGLAALLARERRRSADPLGASDTRPGAARAVHSVRRTHRLYQAADPLGDPRSRAPVRRMAAFGARAAGVGQHLGARSHEPRIARTRGGTARGIRRDAGAPVPG